ncbi:MAG: DNA mismatch repair protein MutS [Pseudomonadota bacterium]
MAPRETAGATPMMAQYLGIKAEHADALLFYRMGDFYELFFEDAEVAAAALDIALTKRGKHLGEDIAMCGVPVHSAEAYLHTLIRKGHRVAVCEQTEDPAEAKKRGSKSVVRREVVRLVTPGTLTEDRLLEARAANYLAAWASLRGEGALAWAELSTGEIGVMAVAEAELGPALARLAPSEVLANEAVIAAPAEEEAGAQEARRALIATLESAGGVLTAQPRSTFDSAGAEARLARLYGVKTLEGFGSFTRPELSALGAVAAYLELTQRGALPRLKPPVRETAAGAMRLDAATRRNLELMRSLSGGRDGSLLAAVDRTRTGPGARLLAARLAAPLTDPAGIAARHDAVDWLMAEPRRRETLAEALAGVPDIERALSRLALGRGGPRDLAALRDGLAAGARIAGALGGEAPEEIAAAARALEGHDALTDLLTTALVESPPLMAREGGFVAEGYDEALDDARALSREGRGVIARLQAEFAAETGVESLKVKHNNVLGYFVETTARHGEAMLAHERADGSRFVHRQTMANAMRFGTAALSDIEGRIVNAGARALEIEAAVFDRLLAAIMSAHGEIAEAARALAALDVAAGSAALAAEADWTRPRIDGSRAFVIEGGRHPVVEQALRRQGASFVPNDAELSAEADGPAPIWLVTGPNMAGKSTFLRQNALLAILAQAGLFVPARAAHIGIVDQVFSRVGAADDLAAGRSTFMVEMVETAAILNQAGPRTLVILDEIGRGTATWDGLSIAWATLEHLHDANRCRGLFATHYHELTALTGRLAQLRPATVAVREWEGEVVFLHELRPGAADRSYGVQVARLAGLPAAVVARAKAVLEKLEAAERGDRVPDLLDGLPLFQQAAAEAPPMAAPAPGARRLTDRLAEIEPDLVTPREALDLLYELKRLTDEE